MIQKRTPVVAKVSLIVKIYAMSMILGCIYQVVRSDYPVLTRDTLLHVITNGIEPKLEGLIMLLIMWALLAHDWRKGGEERMRERLAYKQTLPEIERHLYEIEEFDAKLPQGPRRTTKKFRFLDWRKKLSLVFKN